VNHPTLYQFDGLVDEDGNSECKTFQTLKAARAYAKRKGGQVSRLIPGAYGYETDESFGERGIEEYWPQQTVIA
jgi:hypothetical protein